ncbi:BspA family leucine-rich repeat surface protein [Enterococcus termitis]
MKRSYAFFIAGALFLTIGSTKSVVLAETEQMQTSQNDTALLTSTLKDSGMYGTSSWELYTDGTMTVSSGSFVGELVGNAPWQKYKNIVTKITFTGPVTLQPEANHLFANCRLLTTVNTEQLDTSLVINMGGMFFYCTSLASVDVSTWNTSSAINMGGMFGNCYALTSLNLENFDVSNVTSIAGIFANSGLVDLQVSTWNTISVTDMSAAFYNNRALNYLDITSWSSTQVTSMSAMFGNCTSLSGIKLGDNMIF